MITGLRPTWDIQQLQGQSTYGTDQQTTDLPAENVETENQRPAS